MLKKEEVTFAALKYDFRILAANEAYYKAYDQKGIFIDKDELDYDDD
jgi:hypothetical protein